MADWRDIPLTDGTAQEDRLPRALREGYFRADERSFGQLLALATELAEIIPFYGPDGEQRGEWSSLFRGDEAALLALVLSRNPHRSTGKLARDAQRGVADYATYVYDTACFIDSALRDLQRLDGRAAREFSERIEVIVSERLATPLRRLARLTAEREPALAAAFDFTGFAPAWQTTSTDRPPLSEGAMSGEVPADPREIFDDFAAAVSVLRSRADAYLADSLKTPDHDPAMGLFLAFLELFGTVQARLNRFTDRHLDFYYRTVLGEAPRAAVGERALLALVTSRLLRPLRLTAGTRWQASGTGVGDVRTFVSEAALPLRSTRVAALCTLYLDRDGLISPERELGYVTRLKAASLLPLESEAIERDPSQAWPLFGARARHGAAPAAKDASIGFAVASPALLLKEGTRRIGLTVRLRGPVVPEGLVEEARERFETEAEDVVITAVFASQLRSAETLLGRLRGVDADREARALSRSVSALEMREALEDTVPGRRNRLYDLLLRAMLRRAMREREGSDRKRRFFAVFGAICCRHLFGMGLDESFRSETGHCADEVLGPDDPDSLAVVTRLLGNRRDGAFERLLSDAFEVSVTTAESWYHVRHCTVSRLVAGANEDGAALRFEATLAPAVEPVVAYRASVHGGEMRTSSPVLRLRLGERANFCVYSLLSALALESVVIDTAVRGVRDLQVHNDLGPLDPTRPFNPFGPLPAVGAFLTFGSYEMARKSVKRLVVNLEWSGLPSVSGGLGRHYEGYGQDYADAGFTVEQSALHEGVWLPEAERKRPDSTLFEPGDATGRSSVKQALRIRVLDYLRPLRPGVGEEDFDLHKGARNGFVRLTLSGPPGAFGHAAYPLLFSDALTRNVRWKRKTRAVPNPPYTPALASLTLDYESSDAVRFGDEHAGADGRLDEAVFHLHPFGQAPVRRGGGGRRPPLLPAYGTDGNLFIALDGDVDEGELTLLFHLSAESHSRTVFESRGLAWFYLADDGWCRLLPQRVISDTTRGLMRSGIVTLELPADLDRRGGIMPAGPAWLRVGANDHLESFPALHAIHANALEVTRVAHEVSASNPVEEAHAPLRWRSEAAIPGLERVLQAGELFGGVAAETRERFRARVSERLRHKRRAVTPWDYERLVLERFPRIDKVKCLANMTSATPEPAPGRVLIVVVPAVGDDDPCARPMASVLELREVRDYVAALSSEFVDVEVRNPSYERIQVRCAVEFADAGNDLGYAQKLNSEITAFLSPWTTEGYRTRFGWRIRRDEVEGFIRRRHYVELLSGVSMLHVAESDQTLYSLGDTARALEESAAPDGTLRPRFPWSLALPFRRHHIEPLRTSHPIEALATGVDELEMDSTFIVHGRS